MTAKKKLFLFEILFKQINIDADILLKSFTFNPSELCKIPVTAKVRFLDQAEFQVNFFGKIYGGGGVGEGDDRKPEISEASNDDCAPSGKSCLFPMDTLTLAEDIKKSPVSVEIYTQIENDMTPVFLGRVKIHFDLHFIDVVVSSLNAHDLPVSAFSQSTPSLTNIFGEECGHIEVYYRISCFGSAIMSDFDFLKPVVEAVETGLERNHEEMDNMKSQNQHPVF